MKKPELPNITSIRFFLALLVVIFHVSQFSVSRGLPHYSNLPILQKGTEAVYMFFSLSGFLIIRTLFLEKMETGHISLKNFYLRRIRRIFPLYYIVLLLGLCYYHYLLPAIGFPLEKGNYTMGKALLLGGTFFSNILATYDPGAAVKVLWSIGIEEQFYIVIAPLLLLLPQKRIALFLTLFTLLYFALFYCNFAKLLQAYHMYFYFFSFSGLLAVLQLKKPRFKFCKWMKWLIYLLILFYFSTNLFVTNLTMPAYHLLSMIGFGLFVCCLSETPYSLLENRYLKYFGKISYGIYMTHVFAIHLSAIILMRTNAGKFLTTGWYIFIFTLSAVILTLLVAHLSYRYFESYFLKAKRLRRI
jgi:peptidoglycan/LPS O-acetylase OafA/YrhL